jgi:hypothetical protein
MVRSYSEAERGGFGTCGTRAACLDPLAPLDWDDVVGPVLGVAHPSAILRHCDDVKVRMEVFARTDNVSDRDERFLMEKFTREAVYGRVHRAGFPA